MLLFQDCEEHSSYKSEMIAGEYLLYVQLIVILLSVFLFLSLFDCLIQCFFFRTIHFSSLFRVVQLFVERVLGAVHRTRDIE